MMQKKKKKRTEPRKGPEKSALIYCNINQSTFPFMGPSRFPFFFLPVLENAALLASVWVL